MDNLELDGFERYCKNINFIKSIASYKTYLQKGIGVLRTISNDTIEEFYNKEQQNNKYLKDEFTQQIQKQNLSPDLYSDFKSALKKYMNFINKEYPLNRHEIEEKYNQIFNQIQENGYVKLKTHNNTIFTLETNALSLCVKGAEGKGQECMSVALNKILRILFDNESYTYPSYEPTVINYIFDKAKEEIMNNTEEKNLKKIVKTFQEKWDTTDGLWTKNYIQGLSATYRNFQINISFGKGIRLSKPKIPYMNFLITPFVTSKGIYPFIAYYDENNTFEVGLSVSRDNEPDVEQSVINAIENYESKNIPTNQLDEVIKVLNIAIDNFLKIINKKQEKNNKSNNKASDMSNQTTSKNQILYGPPGTGKTYNTINKAIEIIENRNLTAEELEDRNALKEKFEKYKNNGQIEFITFHQSYGYEEFVEGIKADTNSNDEVIYTKEDGIFKRLALEAMISNIQVTKESIKSLDFGEVYDGLLEKIDSGEITSLSSKTTNDILVSDITKNNNINFKHEGGNKKYLVSKDRLKKLFEYFNTKEKFDSISNINDEFREVIGGCNSSVYWAVLNYIHTHNIDDEYQDIDIKNMTESEQKELIDDYLKTPQSKRKHKENSKNYVLIIDEINRGNISKIFGELITLLEDSKRVGAEEELKVKLPYTNDEFGVPQNLYLLGTMNTADRSIALMDTALRRRFDFSEMMPELDGLKDIVVENTVKIFPLLEAINKRIEYLYDRDHTIGHAYFIELKEDSKNSLLILANIFKNKIIPLLQEYFYDDWEKIRLVLGDNQKNDRALELIKIKQGYNIKDLFGDKGLDSLDIDDESNIYEINQEAFKKPESYIKIYEK